MGHLSTLACFRDSSLALFADVEVDELHLPSPVRLTGWLGEEPLLLTALALACVEVVTLVILGVDQAVGARKANIGVFDDHSVLSGVRKLQVGAKLVL